MSSYVGERYHGVQTSSTNSDTISLLTNATQGNHLILLVGVGTTSKHLSSVTDSVGNTWNVDIVKDDSGAGNRATTNIASAYLTNPITTTDTITLNWNASTSANISIWVEEASGLALSSFFDVSATQQLSNSTSISVGPTLGLSQPNEMAWVIKYSTVDTAGWTHGTNWLDPTTTTQLNGRVAVEYQIVSSTVALTGDGSWTTAGNGTAALATYKNIITSGTSDYFLTEDSYKILLESGSNLLLERQDTWVNDTTTITENVKLMVESYVNKSDSSAVTEFTNVAEADTINVSDSSGVTDAVFRMVENYINVSDSSAVTENSNVAIADQINVNDTSGVTDSVTLQDQDGILVSDSSGVTESIHIEINSQVNVNDSSIITENIQLLDIDNINVSDTSGVTDQVSVAIQASTSVAHTLLLMGVG